MKLCYAVEQATRPFTNMQATKPLPKLNNPDKQLLQSHLHKNCYAGTFLTSQMLSGSMDDRVKGRQSLGKGKPSNS